MCNAVVHRNLMWSGYGAGGARLLLLQLALAGCGAALRAPWQPNPQKGTVYFLMMAEWRIAWEEIWAEFFDGASSCSGARFKVFLHCEDQTACRNQVQRKDLFTIIPTVPSVYCQDLLSPMLALLAAASDPHVLGDPRDAFVFVSGNSLPVKPFWQAQQVLTDDRAGVALFDLGDPTGCGLFKGSQWSVLGRWHAQRMLQAASGVAQDLEGHALFNKTLKVMPEGCSCCLDENWPLVSIFGRDELQKHPPEMPKTLRAQTTMYVDWPVNKRAEANRTEDAQDRMRSERRREDGAGVYGPRTLATVSADLLARLRSHPTILFMRKVARSTRFEGEGDLSMPLAWGAHIFGDSPPLR
mmetsp:Transcript_18603/g.50448  ORF Transcript_18603/g.50448 Transcript_18603/m.50448 type:complete len:355 (-) Transcript_18603:85-1149(-)